MSWKKLGSRSVFDNPWLTVYEDEVVNPGGGRNAYGWVHFKNHAVAVVPVAQDGTTWLVGQDRYTLGEYSWEVPMGGSPVGETLEASAERELREETGLSAGRMKRIMKVHTSNSLTDESGFIFVATELREGEAEPEETEVLRIERLPLAEAVERVLEGRITDAISCLALLRVDAMHRAGDL